MKTIEDLYIKDNIDFTQKYTSGFEFVDENAGVIDLSELEIDRNRTIDINTIFSDTVVFISDKVQVHIKASSAFGSVSLPTGDSVSFGETNFVMGNSDKILYLNVSSAFAQIRVLYK